MNNKDGRISLNATLLKEQRKQRGLSQEKLAEQCRNQGLLISTSSIKRAELGMNVLYRTATHLAKFYAIPLEKLLENKQLINPVTTLPSQLQKSTSAFPYNKKTLLTIILEIRA